MTTFIRRISLGIFLATMFVLPSLASASTQEIDQEVKLSMEHFYKKVHGAQELVSKAKGVLVLPKVYQIGLGLGLQFGKGALLVQGQNNGYYSINGASIGLTAGMRKKSIVLLFMNDQMLEKFMNSKGWRAGIDASVSIVKAASEGFVDTKDVHDKSIIAFVFDQTGLMFNFSLEGSRFTRIDNP